MFQKTGSRYRENPVGSQEPSFKQPFEGTKKKLTILRIIKNEEK